MMQLRKQDKEEILVTAEDVEFVQMLANDTTRAKAVEILDISEAAYDMRLRRMKLKYGGISTNAGLVYLFVKNGLIT